MILASVGGDVAERLPSLGVSLLYLSGILFFLLLNAFFVAAEFAIVKVRPSQLEADGEDPSGRSATALHIVRNLDGYLSANQLGITIASLALGFLGEPFVHALVGPPLVMFGVPRSVDFIHCRDRVLHLLACCHWRTPSKVDCHPPITSNHTTPCGTLACLLQSLSLGHPISQRDGKLVAEDVV